MLKFVIKTLIFFGIVGGLAWAAYRPTVDYWKERNRPKFRTVSVTRGDIVAAVKSTGNVKPVLTVHVGSFVSGPIEELFVDFNDEVEKGELLARIDPRIYEAAVARDKAVLATRKAEVIRVKARLQNAINDERRAKGLRSDNPDFISDAEMDQIRFTKEALEAELAVAEAAVLQAEAELGNSSANLEYTKITSPVDGVIIDRKIDPGQTLASQFQTPELFIVAPDMREEMHIFASVDEADIGLIRRAEEENQTVHFTVDAYPGEVFEGQIYQIRLSSVTTQNVVTYPVVVSAANPELKLLPGMTANLSFQVDEKKDVLKVPNSALRYYPNRERVRKEDRSLLDGSEEAEPAPPPTLGTPDERDRFRHVWVQEGDFLRAVEVETGISDYTFTEVLSGDLQEGQQLVIGEQTE